jgi:phosphoribosylanthranilate isomerase
MKTKICGITSEDDALMCIDAGADMLGFNFYSKSPRYITPEACVAIQSKITNHKSQITTVGVFVNSQPEEILAILDFCKLDLAQLSGDEALQDLVSLNGRAFKALRIRDVETAPAMLAAIPVRMDPPACLIDSHVAGQYGGTGRTTDWVVAADLARRAPILLAGGLTPENVAVAVRQVQPWGVDVASGVESSPGKKDPFKVGRFIRNARAADGGQEIPIGDASREDLAEILALQKLAYRSEAELNNDFGIPPMTQELDGIEAEFRQRVFLKAVVNGKIVGSVRAHLDEGTCHIGRLIVHPEAQNRGLGTRLLQAIEQRFSDARRYELFTSERSTRNLYLYRKHGYRDFRVEPMNQTKIIFLEKGNCL